MAESILDQVLDLVGPQIQILSETVDSAIVQEANLTPRTFDWDDIDKHCPGVSVRFVENTTRAGQAANTNGYNVIGVPVYVVMVSPTGEIERDDLGRAFAKLRQDIRRYYHHRRRMAKVAGEGVLTSVSTVEDGGPSPPKDVSVKHNIQIQTIVFWFEEPQTA